MELDPTALKVDAEKGDSVAQRNLAIFYQMESIPKDYEKALFWYLKAAEKEDPIAYNQIGFFYANGIVVEKDYKKSIEWRIKAALEGLTSALPVVGAAYHSGIGVPKDPIEGYAWVKTASLIDEIYTDKLPIYMTGLSKEEIMIGDRRAKKILFKIYKLDDPESTPSSYRDIINKVLSEYLKPGGKAFAFALFHHNEGLRNSSNEDKFFNKYHNYTLVHSTNSSSINDLWFLLKTNPLDYTADIIASGGSIERLKVDLFDAPGFDHSNTNETFIYKSNEINFPQRRVMSAKQLETDVATYLNGKDGEADFCFLWGVNGWHLLKYEKLGKNDKVTIFDRGLHINLIKIDGDQYLRDTKN
jgi:hypothetical protein